VCVCVWRGVTVPKSPSVLFSKMLMPEYSKKGRKDGRKEHCEASTGRSTSWRPSTGLRGPILVQRHMGGLGGPRSPLPLTQHSGGRRDTEHLRMARKAGLDTGVQGLGA
jgi:hypothetical protein